jgi:tRNA G18 (ribose-2'-O)-methylase SpoU
MGTLIRSAVAFNANYVFTIGKRYKSQCSSIGTDKHIPIFHYATIEQWRENLPQNARVVCVELSDRAVSIADFEHPQAAVYLLGAEDTGIPEPLMDGFEIIQLPGQLCLNVAVAGSMVLYDRWLKQRRQQ